MANITNIGTPTVANKAFVPLAVEAGIEQVIASLVPLAIDKRSLLIALVEALADTNPALAAALNMDTLDAVLKYMALKPKSPITLTSELPEMLDEDGPASVTAARDGGAATQINITFSEPPAGYKYAIYLDSIFQKVGNAAAVDGWVNDALQDVVDDGQQHTIRVLFVSPEQAITRFGPLAAFV